jgi:hypothetical protein
MKGRLALGLLVLVLGALADVSRADDAKKGGAATPQEALERLKKSAETGDTTLMEGLFTEPFGSFLSRMFAAGRRVSAALDDLKVAAKEKFGPEAGDALGKDPGMFAPKAFDGTIEILDLKVEDDKASATVRSTPKQGAARNEPVNLVKQGDVWKIEPPGKQMPKEEDMEQMNAIADGTANGYKELADGVRKGDIKTLDELKQKKHEAEQAVMMKLFQDMQRRQQQHGTPNGPTGTATPKGGDEGGKPAGGGK